MERGTARKTQLGGSMGSPTFDSPDECFVAGFVEAVHELNRNLLVIIQSEPHSCRIKQVRLFNLIDLVQIVGAEKQEADELGAGDFVKSGVDTTIGRTAGTVGKVQAALVVVQIFTDSIFMQTAFQAMHSGTFFPGHGAPM